MPPRGLPTLVVLQREGWERVKKKERKQTTQGRDGRTVHRHHTGIFRRSVVRGVGQRPSLSHLIGYPEAVASAQDFVPGRRFRRIFGRVEPSPPELVGGVRECVCPSRPSKGILLLACHPWPRPRAQKGEIPVPLHHRTKRVSVRGPVSTVRGYCDPEVPPGRPQRPPLVEEHYLGGSETLT